MKQIVIMFYPCFRYWIQYQKSSGGVNIERVHCYTQQVMYVEPVCLPSDDASSETKPSPYWTMISSGGLKHPIQIIDFGSQKFCLPVQLVNLITCIHTLKGSWLAVTAWLFTINEINAAIFITRESYMKVSLRAVDLGQRKNKNKSKE